MLDHRVAGLGGNTTLIVVVTSHHDVAFEAPASTPAVCVVCVCVYEFVWWEREGRKGREEKVTLAQKRVWSELLHSTQKRVWSEPSCSPVLDKPIVLAFIYSIADHKHSMIQAGL